MKSKMKKPIVSIITAEIIKAHSIVSGLYSTVTAAVAADASPEGRKLIRHRFTGLQDDVVLLKYMIKNVETGLLQRNRACQNDHNEKV